MEASLTDSTIKYQGIRLPKQGRACPFLPTHHPRKYHNGMRCWSTPNSCFNLQTCASVSLVTQGTERVPYQSTLKISTKNNLCKMRPLMSSSNEKLNRN